MGSMVLTTVFGFLMWMSAPAAFSTRSVSALSAPSSCTGTGSTPLFVSSGFSFDDGNQVLVSVQKPLGIVLEQEDAGSLEIVVASVDESGSTGRAGVQVGDVLLAVQNANTEREPLEYVLEIIGRAPRVVNLRFART
jgi:hypothetical protein